MTIWQLLETEPTKDKTAIKKAFAAQVKKHKPSDDAELYQLLREAYNAALAFADSDEEIEEEPEETEETSDAEAAENEERDDGPSIDKNAFFESIIKEIEETELDEIDDIPLHEPVNGVPDSTGDNECKSYRLQSARLLDRRKEKHSDCKANYQRKDTQPKRRIGEYSPSTTRVVHKLDIDKSQEGTCQYAAGLHVGEMAFGELVNQHP